MRIKAQDKKKGGETSDREGEIGKSDTHKKYKCRRGGTCELEDLGQLFLSLHEGRIEFLRTDLFPWVQGMEVIKAKREKRRQGRDTLVQKFVKERLLLDDHGGQQPKNLVDLLGLGVEEAEGREHQRQEADRDGQETHNQSQDLQQGRAVLVLLLQGLRSGAKGVTEKEGRLLLYVHLSGTGSNKRKEKKGWQDKHQNSQRSCCACP